VKRLDLDPKKLNTIFNGVTPINPIIPRKYTLTHSDITAELFLAVGWKFAYEATGPMRDEVLAKWHRHQNGYALYGLVQVDSQNGNKAASAVRYKVFQQELPLAFEAIRYGDRKFFHAHPTLDDAPIWITFSSVYPEYNGIQYWGTPSKYVTT
jgi:hypothetical protein